jgi:hypothetical protein
MSPNAQFKPHFQVTKRNAHSLTTAKGAMALSITTLSITTFSITTFSITTISIMTLSITFKQ